VVNGIKLKENLTAVVPIEKLRFVVKESKISNPHLSHIAPKPNTKKR
jgi:hypothetical protein